MLRKEKILMACKKISPPLTSKAIEKYDIGFTTESVANSVEISRSNVSTELNQLVKEGILLKVQGRPVRYLFRRQAEEYLGDSIEKGISVLPYRVLAERRKEAPGILTEEDPFRGIIGAQGSLKKLFLQLKAAAIYPPCGLHTILTGETGVGKSMLAEKMFQFAKMRGMISSGGKFITYNCAEYANNPQLILSYLFGYKKGAFTDAKEDTVGVIEAADGGMLFLDEIHRLSHEAQELLFTFIDKGTFHRIGESHITRTAKVFLIGATTEMPTAVLLKTFIRRMPNVVVVPNLSDRGFVERIQFVKFFFTQEALAIQKQIVVSASVMKLFSIYKCPGNIGQLKTDIKLICANAYLNYQEDNSEKVYIDLGSLPDAIYDSFLSIDEVETLLSGLESALNEKQYSFPENTVLGNEMMQCKWADEVYQVLLKDFFEYYLLGCDFASMHSALGKKFKRYFIELVDECQKGKKLNIRNTLQLNMVSFFNKVERVLEIQFPLAVITALSWHISMNYEYMKNAKDVVFEEIDKESIDFRLLQMLGEDLGFPFPHSELLILKAAREYRLDIAEHNKVAVIIAAFGGTTASNIGAVVNRLLGEEYCIMQDLNLSETTDNLFRIVRTLLLSCNNREGVVVFIDMVSLKTMFQVVSQQLGIPIFCIINTSVTTIVNISKKCMKAGYSLEEIENFYENGMSGMVSDPEKKKYICVSCGSGKGTSLHIISYIKKTFSEPVLQQFRFVNSSYEEIGKQIKKEELLVIIGTKKPLMDIVPFIHVNEFIYGNGLQKLMQIIQGKEEVVSPINRVENVLMQIIRDSSTFIDSQKAWSLLDHAFDRLIYYLKEEELDNLRVRFILHGVPMLERCIRHETLVNANTKEYISKYQETYTILKGVFREVEESFSCEIPDSELTYILEMIC